MMMMMNVEGPVHTRMGPTMSDSAVTTQNRGGGSSLVNELRQLRAYKSSDAPRKITTIIIIISSSNRLQPASASVRYH